MNESIKWLNLSAAQNFNKGIALLNTAVDQDNANTMTILGGLYCKDIGVAQDFDRRITLLNQAAKFRGDFHGLFCQDRQISKFKKKDGSIYRNPDFILQGNTYIYEEYFYAKSFGSSDFKKK